MQLGGVLKTQEHNQIVYSCTFHFRTFHFNRFIDGIKLKRRHTRLHAVRLV